MAKLPQQLSVPQMQTTWASILDPVVANPLNNGVFITNQPLAIGSNSINHRLSRKPQGYIITGMRGAFSQIYQEVSQTPDLTTVLNSSAVTTVDLYVF